MMPDKVVPGPVGETACIQEAVCIHTKKIFDSCRSKDCVEDLRFYPTAQAQSIIERAISVKAGKAELLHVYIDVEPVGFNRGFYTVDVRYFYRVTVHAFVGAARPIDVDGLCVFEKRAILFGSEASAKIFTSQTNQNEKSERGVSKSSLPTAVVEAVDPVVLSTKLVEVCECRTSDCELTEVPASICACFGSELCFGGEVKRVYVTLGQFSIIRLERDTQLLMPAYDYCMPDNVCGCDAGGEEDPCEVFQRVQFPVNEFFPPNHASGRECYQKVNDC